jgi:hypothetical protein
MSLASPFARSLFLPYSISLSQTGSLYWANTTTEFPGSVSSAELDNP